MNQSIMPTLAATFAVFLTFCFLSEAQVSVPMRGNGYIWTKNVTWLSLWSSMDHMSRQRSKHFAVNMPSDAVLRLYFLPRSSGTFFVELQARSPLQCKSISVEYYVSNGSNATLANSKSIPCNQTYFVPYLQSVANKYSFLQLTSKEMNAIQLYRNIQNVRFSGTAATELEANFGDQTSGQIWLTVPSVHWSYGTWSSEKVTWFYNEIMVPSGSDLPSSYYMSAGGQDFYSGIQVNQDGNFNRCVIFSVWASDDVQNHDDVDVDLKVKPMKIGRQVKVQDFGNEGSGKKSQLEYDWKPDTWYKFLVTATLDGEDTIFNGYFKGPEHSNFRLMASFRKPKTYGTMLSGLYSFVEQYGRDQLGFLKHELHLRNPWVKTTSEQWYSISRFQATTTANKDAHQRYDLGGRLQRESDNYAILSSGGFESVVNLTSTDYFRLQFSKPLAEDKKPDISFEFGEEPESDLENEVWVWPSSK